jgi:hypothetical protein
MIYKFFLSSAAEQKEAANVGCLLPVYKVRFFVPYAGITQCPA